MFLCFSGWTMFIVLNKPKVKLFFQCYILVIWLLLTSTTISSLRHEVSIFFFLALKRSIQCFPARITDSKIVIHEVSYSHTLPFVELIRATDEPPNAPTEVLGYYGLLVAEYQRKFKNYLLRVAVDCSGSRWDAINKYFVIGRWEEHEDFPGISMSVGNVNKFRIFPRERSTRYNWLEPPNNSLLMVILTKSETKPIFDPTLLDPTKAYQSTKFEGPIYDYAVENSVDMVLIGGKKAPVKCKNSGFLTFLGQFYGEEPEPQYLLPTDGDVKKSVNRCKRDDDIQTRTPFSHFHFQHGSPTPNNKNDCCKAYRNPQQIVDQDPETVQLPDQVMAPVDGCQVEEDPQGDLDAENGYAHNNPVLEFAPDRLQQAIARNDKKNKGACQKPKRFPKDMADIDLALRKHDLDVAEFDALYLEKIAPYDDAWVCTSLL